MPPAGRISCELGPSRIVLTIVKGLHGVENPPRDCLIDELTVRLFLVEAFVLVAMLARLSPATTHFLGLLQ